MMKTLTNSIAAVAFIFVAGTTGASLAGDHNVEIKGSYVHQHASLNDVTVKGKKSKLTVNTIKNAKIENSTIHQHAYLRDVTVKRQGTLEVNAIGESK